MTLFDWPLLMRLGLCELRLKPDEFWGLTPVELRIMLGHDLMRSPLSRADISAMEALFSHFE